MPPPASLALRLSQHLTGQPLGLEQLPLRLQLRREAAQPAERTRANNRALSSLIRTGQVPAPPRQDSETPTNYLQRTLSQYAAGLTPHLQLFLTSGLELKQQAQHYHDEHPEDPLHDADPYLSIWTHSNQRVHIAHFLNDPELQRLHGRFAGSVSEHLVRSCSMGLGAWGVREAYDAAEQAWWYGESDTFEDETYQEACRHLNKEELSDAEFADYLRQENITSSSVFKGRVGRQHFVSAWEPLADRTLHRLIRKHPDAQTRGALRQLLRLIGKARQCDQQLRKLHTEESEIITTLCDFQPNFNTQPTYLLEPEEGAETHPWPLYSELLYETHQQFDENIESPQFGIHLDGTLAQAQHAVQVLQVFDEQAQALDQATRILNNWNAPYQPPQPT